MPSLSQIFGVKPKSKGKKSASNQGSLLPLDQAKSPVPHLPTISELDRGQENGENLDIPDLISELQNSAASRINSSSSSRDFCDSISSNISPRSSSNGLAATNGVSNQRTARSASHRNGHDLSHEPYESRYERYKQHCK